MYLVAGGRGSLSDPRFTLSFIFHIRSVSTLCVHAKSLQSCLTLWDPMDCSPPGSSVRGTLQERILECEAIAFSRGSSLSRDQTCISYTSCTGGGFFFLPLAPSGKRVYSEGFDFKTSPDFNSTSVHPCSLLSLTYIYLPGPITLPLLAPCNSSFTPWRLFSTYNKMAFQKYESDSDQLPLKRIHET